jgi:hypothetical protein
LVTEAFALLQANDDILEFACCLVYGPDSDECDCMMDYIRGTGNRDISFRGGNEDCETPGIDAAARIDDNIIWICQATIDLFMDDFLNGDTHERQCAILSLAGNVIVAELPHLCGLEHVTDPGCETDQIHAFKDLVNPGLEARCGDGDSGCYQEV